MQLTTFDSGAHGPRQFYLISLDVQPVPTQFKPIAGQPGRPLLMSRPAHFKTDLPVRNSRRARPYVFIGVGPWTSPSHANLIDLMTSTAATPVIIS